MLWNRSQVMAIVFFSHFIWVGKNGSQNLLNQSSSTGQTGKKPQKKIQFSIFSPKIFWNVLDPLDVDIYVHSDHIEFN